MIMMIMIMMMKIKMRMKAFENMCTLPDLHKKEFCHYNDHEETLLREI
jgi:hypothetical protein